MRIVLLLATGWALSGSMPVFGDEPGSGKAEFFEARIRPILVEHCTRCHGPGKQESGLRLDSRAGLLKGNDAGAVVMPGHPEESPIVEAVRYDAAVKMPPAGKLPDRSIADLAAWVKMGAPWPDSSAGPSSSSGVPDARAIAASARRHWAFRPVRDMRPPPVRNADWPTGPLDRFVLARLEAAGIKPSPPANRRTLIRRLTFDLDGLPPTPEEVAAFEADPSPDADIRLVDRLLASPRYGERWGRFWLDVARYADTKGYVFFQDADFHWAYTYRDYVIAAFNRDTPYDRFIVEQLAADLLGASLPDGPSWHGLPGRGPAWHGLPGRGPVHGQDARATQDRPPLEALGFLSLGGRFMGNFHDVVDDRIDVVCRGLMSLTVTCARCHDHKFDPIPTRDYYSLYGVMAGAREPMIPPEAGVPPRTAAHGTFVRELDAHRQKLSEFVAAKHRELVAAAKQRAGEYLLAAQEAIDRPTTEDFMLIADGTDLNPAMLVRWQSYLARTRKVRDPVFAPWHALAALPPGEFARFLKTAPGDPLVNPVIARALAEGRPGSIADVAQIYGRELNRAEALWSIALWAGRGREPRLPAAVEELHRVFHGPDSPADVPLDPFGELALLPDRPSQAKLKELRDALQKWLTDGPGAPARAMALEDVPSPIEPRVFIRGNPNNPGDRVPRRFLEVLSGPDRAPFRNGSGRLELARAIASRDNPLTARALVNRVWMHHFGTPLVATPGDFGLRSDPPTHPELLDHLAARFMDDGWSIKALHRRIVLSATYRQQSADRHDARAIDLENALYWRMNRRRLDLEAARDALLAVSGHLDGRLGGPPMPALTGPGATRRTLYGFLDRLNLPGLYRTFDFPDPNATSPRRDQTTVAPQALFLMNHTFAIDAARGVLRRPDVADLRDPDAKLARIYRLLYGRAPDADEVAMARDFLADRSGGPDPWPALAQALLMANEFVLVD